MHRPLDVNTGQPLEPAGEDQTPEVAVPEGEVKTTPEGEVKTTPEGEIPPPSV